MTLVLISAMAVSFGTMDWVSGGVIAALVILNVGVGTVNEYKAEKVSYRETGVVVFDFIVDADHFLLPIDRRCS